MAMTLESRVKRALVRHPDWGNERIANSTGARQPLIKAVRSGAPMIPADVPALSADKAAPLRADFSLNGVHLLSRKPLDVMKGRFHSLQKGVGYKIETLCNAWGCSEDTLRDHGKKHNALRYVEATPGEYITVIVHPETKQGV